MSEKLLWCKFLAHVISYKLICFDCCLTFLFFFKLFLFPGAEMGQSVFQNKCQFILSLSIEESKKGFTLQEWYILYHLFFSKKLIPKAAMSSSNHQRYYYIVWDRFIALRDFIFCDCYFDSRWNQPEFLTIDEWWSPEVNLYDVRESIHMKFILRSSIVFHSPGTSIIFLGFHEP